MSNVGGAAVISLTEGVIVRGILRKLKDSGIDAFFAGSDVVKIKQKTADTNIYIIYLSGKLKDLSLCLTNLKNIVGNSGKGVIVIGTKPEQEEVKKLVPDLAVTTWYERMPDINVFMKQIELFLEKYKMDREKKKILIVDDDPSYARIVREWLLVKYHVAVVTSGMQAINFLRKNYVDLVLLDYEMPVTDGPKVLKLMREDPLTSAVPVIFLTGVGDKESVVHVMSLKPDGYILKTASREQIMQRMEECFQK